MRLIRNPSYTHSVEFIESFRKYSSNIFYKDFTQYSNDLLVVTIFAVEKGKEFNLKSNELLWLTKLVYELNLSENQVEEDYLPILKFYTRNKSKLNPIETYKSIGELNSHIESLSGNEEFVSEKDLDIFFEKDGWFLAMPHTTEASCLLGKETSWCTARTKSQNLFLNYVGRYEDDIVLFYIIKIDGNPKKNPNDKLSVGFENEKPIFDGKPGGLTVNASNKGLTIEQFGEILGKDLAQTMLIRMDEKSQSIKGKHPAKKEMEKIANSVERYLKKISEFKSEETLLEFKREIAKYPISDEIAIILSEDRDEFARMRLAMNSSLTEKIQLKLSFDKNQSVRDYLAKNQSITEKIQMILSEDKAVWVREHLAGNKSIIEEVQLKLSEDENRKTLEILAMNPSITEKVQLKLIDNKYQFLKRYLAKNRSLTEMVQLKLSRDIDKWVRFYLAENTSLTESTLIKLSKDEDEDIRRFVLSLLNKKAQKRLMDQQ